ncbi:MAG: flagellar hook-length control protein FliK [Pseudomonadota bacterium]
MQSILALTTTAKLPTTEEAAKLDGRVLGLRLPGSDTTDEAALDTADFAAIFQGEDGEPLPETPAPVVKTPDDPESILQSAEAPADAVEADTIDAIDETAPDVVLAPGPTEDVTEIATPPKVTPTDTPEFQPARLPDAAVIPSQAPLTTDSPTVAQPAETTRPKSPPHILETVLTAQRQTVTPPSNDVPRGQTDKIVLPQTAPHIPTTAAPPAIPQTAATASAAPQTAPVPEATAPEKNPASNIARVDGSQPADRQVSRPLAVPVDVPSARSATLPEGHAREPRIERARMSEPPPGTSSTPQPTQTLAKSAPGITPAAQAFTLSEMPARAIQETLTKLQGEPTEIIQWDIRGTQSLPQQSAPITTMLSRPELPPNIAGQIAAALSKGADKPIEIALNPPELGRVRMMLTASDTGMVVQVLTDRADTLDLMRRNIDDLGRALSDLGYEDLSFAFGQGQDDAPGNGQQDPETLHVEQAETAASTIAVTDATRLAMVSDGVDIRI